MDICLYELYSLFWSEEFLFQTCQRIWQTPCDYSVCVFVYGPSYTEFLSPASSYFHQTEGKETVVLLSEQVLKETAHKDAGWRQSCGGSCLALRNLPNCFISWTTVRWARRLLLHEVSHLYGMSLTVMLVLFRYFQPCHDQNFPPFATDGSQPFIVHTWQTKAFCFVIM
jgi:hypothetical protein